MDPSAVIYYYHKGKIAEKKVKKLKNGDEIIVVGKDWNVRTAKVEMIRKLKLPSMLISRIKFKNGYTIIKSNEPKLYKLYDTPTYDNNEYSGTFMTFKNNSIGMTEIELVEGLDIGNKLVKMISFKCIDNDGNTVDGMIVNGVAVNS